MFLQTMDMLHLYICLVQSLCSDNTALKVWYGLGKKKQKNTWLGSGKDHVLLCRHVSLSKPGSVATKRRDNILDSR